MNCPRRAAIAKIVMAPEIEELDVNTYKIRLLCHSEFIEASEKGTLGPKLFSILRTFAAMALENIEELEGLNGVIKSLSDQSPNISFELLDAELKIKKALSVSGRLDKMPLKDLRPKAQGLCTALIPVVHDALPKPSHGETRYGPPSAKRLVGLPKDSLLKLTTFRLYPELRVNSTLY